MAQTMAKPPLFPGIRVLSRFFSPAWWHHVFLFSWQFRRRLVLPSALFFVAAVIFTFVINLMMELNQKPGQEAINANELLPKLLTGLAGLSLGGILFIVALSFLLVSLMTFTRAYLVFPLPANVSETRAADYSAKIEQSFLSAAVDLKTHKGYLTKVLLLEALICLPLILTFCVTFLFSGVLAAPDTSSMTIPPEMRALALPVQITAAVLFVILSNYSVVSVAVAIMFERTVGKAITFSLLLGLTSALLMSVMTGVTTVLSTVLTTPYVAIGLFNANTAWATPGNIYQQLGWETWQVLAGFIVYPLCTAMLFEVVRDAVQTPPEQQETVPEPSKSSLEPSVDPSVDPSVEPSVDPSADPSVDQPVNPATEV
jgi:hypothetical protein